MVGSVTPSFQDAAGLAAFQLSMCLMGPVVLASPDRVLWRVWLLYL